MSLLVTEEKEKMTMMNIMNDKERQRGGRQQRAEDDGGRMKDEKDERCK